MTDRSRVVAVMQPYFYPYLGYYRLLEAADVFVLFDCVQFPRRGWVHRNRLPGPTGELEWLTLPLAHQPREVLIQDLVFHQEAGILWMERLSRFPQLRPPALGADVASTVEKKLWPILTDISGDVVTYLEEGIRFIAEILGINIKLIRSSSIALPRRLAGQERIVALVRELGGELYVNAPGGRSLYDRMLFQQAGVRLCFLQPYMGDTTSVLARVVAESADRLRSELTANTVISD